MGLDELLRDGRLKAHAPNREESARLLSAAQRNLADAQLAGLSDESRFDLAYKAIMQCAILALMQRGYKTIDVLIATRCIAKQMPLLFGDRDFDPFVQHLGLSSALPEP